MFNVPSSINLIPFYAKMGASLQDYVEDEVTWMSMEL